MKVLPIVLIALTTIQSNVAGNHIFDFDRKQELNKYKYLCFTVLDGALNAFSIYGGKNQQSPVQIFNDILGVCSITHSDVPFTPQHSIALRDYLGRPVVCGGSQNPNQKSCYVYQAGTDTWTERPGMKRRRDGALATCLENGVCYVFGGKR